MKIYIYVDIVHTPIFSSVKLAHTIAMRILLMYEMLESFFADLLIFIEYSDINPKIYN